MTNPKKVKTAAKTTAKKDEYVFGIHAVDALLAAHPQQIRQIFLQKDRQDARMQALQQSAQQAGISVQFAERANLGKLCGSDQHQGAVARCRPSKAASEALLNQLIAQGADLLLILDGVTDPHNLGACLRVANGAGAQAVIAPQHNAASLSPSARKVACGGAEGTPYIQVGNLARTLTQLKNQGFWLIGLADSLAQDFYQQDLTAKVALILGAEDKGLRQLTREHCDHLCALPMAGAVSSLNVSTAAAVCLYEAYRQRQRV